MTATKNKKSTRLLWISLFLILLVSLVLFFNKGNDLSTGNIQDNEIRKEPVRVVYATRDTLQMTRTFPGNLEAWEHAFVAGINGARIMRLHVKEGDFVQKGQLLAEMERTSLHQTEVQLQTAQNELNRLRNLKEAGAVSGSQVEQAETQYENLLSSYDQIKDNTYIHAPIDGVITGKYFVEGELFTPGGERPALLAIMTTDPLKVTIHASERLYPLIKEGMEVTVITDTYPDAPVQGIVDLIGPVIDSRSRTFKIEVRIENRNRKLSPGMFARVQVRLGEQEGLFLPSATLLRLPDNDDLYVYAIENGTARRIHVRTGQRHEDVVQIMDGIEENTPVLIEGIGRVSDGTPVNIIE